MTMTERNPLRLMTERITNQGWTKHQYYNHGRTCLLGAAGMSQGLNALVYRGVIDDKDAPPWLVVLAEVIAEQYPDRVCQLLGREGRTVMVIPVFNDRVETRRNEVLAVLEKAAIRWDERVADD